MDLIKASVIFTQLYQNFTLVLIFFLVKKKSNPINSFDYPLSKSLKIRFPCIYHGKNPEKHLSKMQWCRYY